MYKMKHLFTVAIIAAVPLETQAYVGPGLGVGVIGVIIGLLASILVAIFAIFWYPIKRMLKKKRKKKADDAAPQDGGPDATKND